jgi:hypothetical protein
MGTSMSDWWAGLSDNDQLRTASVAIIITLVVGLVLGFLIRLLTDRRRRWNRDRYEAFVAVELAGTAYWDMFSQDGQWTVDGDEYDRRHAALRAAYSRARLICRRKSTMKAVSELHTALNLLPETLRQRLDFRAADQRAWDAFQVTLRRFRAELGLAKVKSREYQAPTAELLAQPVEAETRRIEPVLQQPFADAVVPEPPDWDSGR